MTPEAYCQQKAAKSGSSFYYSFLFLPPLKRKAMTALYAFCREIDDVVDNIGEHSVATLKLNWWSEEIDRLFEGQPTHPITKALLPFRQECGWDKQWFKDLIFGMRMDLNFKPYETFKDLEHYCYYVAGVVGILSTHIFGYKNESTLEFSKNLGISLQLINIIRDLHEDAARGRVYLPEEDLIAHGLTFDDVLTHTCSPEALQKVLALQATRAKHYFNEALKVLPETDRYAQLSGLIMGQIYCALLKTIEDAHFQVLTHKISLTPIKKLWVAWKTLRQEKKRYHTFLRYHANA